MAVTSAGTGRTNAGNIFATRTGGTHTAGVPDDFLELEGRISAGFTISDSTVGTVPAGSTLYISNIEVLTAAGKTVTFQGKLYNPGLDVILVVFEGIAKDTNFKLTRGSYVAIPEKATLWVEAAVDSTTAAVSFAIDGWLVDNAKILKGEGIA